MSKTLSQIIGDVRLDLHDTDATNYRWPDAVLQRAVDLARLELQLVAPRERTTDLVMTAGVRQYSLAGVTDLLWVERAQFDAVAQPYPPIWAPFQLWGSTLTLLLASAPAGGETVRLYYAGAHLVDATGNTAPLEHEHLLAVGAAVHAVLEAGVAAIARFNSSERTPDQWRDWFQGRRHAWEQGLALLRRAAAARVRTFTAGWEVA